MTDLRAAIAPCPFCGGDAAPGTVRYSSTTIREQNWGQDTFHYVNCAHCGSNNRGLVGYRTPELAAEHWNRRAAAERAAGPTCDGCGKPVRPLLCGHCAPEPHTVDCIGLALDLEARARTVESQTTQRAMEAAARGLRLLAPPASEPPAAPDDAALVERLRRAADAQDAGWLDSNQVARNFREAATRIAALTAEMANQQHDITRLYASLQAESAALAAASADDLERECADADRICAALGLTVEQSRTEGGSLNVPRIVAHINETLTALRESHAFGVAMSDRYIASQAAERALAALREQLATAKADRNTYDAAHKRQAVATLQANERAERAEPQPEEGDGK